jgi:hypothetical protein
MQRAANAVPAGRVITRWFFVLALSIWSIGVIIPSLGRLWSPLGVIGLGCTVDGRITSIDPNGPAAHAGIRGGDQFDLRATEFESRRVVAEGCSLIPRATYHLAIAHGAIVHHVNLSTIPENLGIWSRIGLVLRTAAAIILVVTGALLLLLRPSLMTWALFLFVVGNNPGSHGGFWALLPYSGEAIEQFAEAVTRVVGGIGAMVFLILFPTDTPISRWTAVVLRAAPWLLALGVATDIYSYIATYAFWPVDDVQLGNLIFFSLITPLIGIAAFLERYVHALGADRARIRWVGAALAVGLTGTLAGGFLEVWTPGSAPYVVLSFLYSALIVVPFAVLYAVLKHHVIDVRFFISRAIVYTLLTGLIILVFSLIDWFFSKKLAASGVGTGIDVLLAIGLGFSLNGLHDRVGTIVDRVFFRQRREAEIRLERAMRSIAHASTPAAVQQLLVKTPYEALHLESAALFRPGADGAFRREYALNWPEATVAGISADDLLVLHLMADREPRRLNEIAWDSEDLPRGNASPVIAFPVFVRQRLEAFVLFGSHRNGADIDPDEQHSLTQLAANAGAAYDHIDAECARADNAALRLQLTSFGIT